MARLRRKLPVFSDCTTLGWVPTGRIHFSEGEELVSKGVWRRVQDIHGAHIGYQPLVSHARPSAPEFSRAALGAAEMRANAGLLGRSRTARMSDAERRTRVHPKSGRMLPEMDFVERVRVLVKCYPHSANFHDVEKRGISDRAARVYPKG